MQVWDARSAWRVRVAECGQDFSNSVGCGTVLNFEGAGLERTQSNKPAQVSSLCAYYSVTRHICACCECCTANAKLEEFWKRVHLENLISTPNLLLRQYNAHGFVVQIRRSNWRTWAFHRLCFPFNETTASFSVEHAILCLFFHKRSMVILFLNFK